MASTAIWLQRIGIIGKDISNGEWCNLRILMGQLQAYAYLIIKILCKYNNDTVIFTENFDDLSTKKIRTTTFNCISIILLAEDIVHKNSNKE